MTREDAAPGLALLAYPATGACGARGRASCRRFSTRAPDRARRFARRTSSTSSGRACVSGRRRRPSAGAARLVADGLCLAAVLVAMLDLSTLLAQRARGMHDALLAWPSLALLAGGARARARRARPARGRHGAPVDRVCGCRKLMGACIPVSKGLAPGASARTPVFAVLAACAAAAPARSRLTWRGSIVPATLVATLGPSNGEQNPLLLAARRRRGDPRDRCRRRDAPDRSAPGDRGRRRRRRRSGSSVAGHAPSALMLVLFLAAAPAVLAITVARIRYLHQRTPI